MPDILIIGDSFSASAHQESWTQKLHGYHVDNISSNGSSQYRIWKKLLQCDIDRYTCILLVHTSPNRIYITDNPLHRCSETHQNCDLIYRDVQDKLPDKFAEHVTWWFENVFDFDHANDVHNLLIDSCHRMTAHKAVLHMSFFDLRSDVIDFSRFWKQFPGNINHMNRQGKDLVAQEINNMLQSMKGESS